MKLNQQTKFFHLGFVLILCFLQFLGCAKNFVPIESKDLVIEPKTSSDADPKSDFKSDSPPPSTPSSPTDNGRQGNQGTTKTVPLTSAELAQLMELLSKVYGDKVSQLQKSVGPKATSIQFDGKLESASIQIKLEDGGVIAFSEVKIDSSKEGLNRHQQNNFDLEIICINPKCEVVFFHVSKKAENSLVFRQIFILKLDAGEYKVATTPPKSEQQAHPSPQPGQPPAPQGPPAPNPSQASPQEQTEKQLKQLLNDNLKEIQALIQKKVTDLGTVYTSKVLSGLVASKLFTDFSVVQGKLNFSIEALYEDLNSVKYEGVLESTPTEFTDDSGKNNLFVFPFSNQQAALFIFFAKELEVTPQGTKSGLQAIFCSHLIDQNKVYHQCETLAD